MENRILGMFLIFSVALGSSCALIGGQNLDQGVLLFNQGRFAEAVPYLEAATRDHPDSAQAYLYLGRAHLSQGNWRSAIQPLRTAFRLSPADAQQEIVDLIIDAGFAAALSDFRLGDLFNGTTPAAPVL